MSMRVFDLTSKGHEAIVKEAFLLTAGLAAAKGLGKMIARNPGKTLGAAFAASDIASGTKKLTNMAGRASSGRVAQLGPTM